MASRKRVFDLLRTINAASCRCPAHSHRGNVQVSNSTPLPTNGFEIKHSTVRYGVGVTREIGYDLINLGAKNVCVMTDPNVVNLSPMKAVLEALTKSGINFKVYDRVHVEPTESSFIDAVKFAQENKFDSFVAVGGGSTIDTCKAANLLCCYPEAELMDFVSTPFGKARKIDKTLKPLIAIPTTSGTGAETTGVSIFSSDSVKAKIGLANSSLRPLLAIIDPLHTLTVPQTVANYAGFDIFCHALESFTAIPYTKREEPADPSLKKPDAYQGSNPISDVWARFCLQTIQKYFARSVYNADDIDARSGMHLAATMAGVGIGNAGVHLCHGLAYPIAGRVKEFTPKKDYGEKPIIPHGLSVVVTAPAVFNFTAVSDPDKHLEAANLLGADTTGIKQADAGKLLADTIRKYMDIMKIDNGLTALGYSGSDIPSLVEGALPQQRLLKMSPLPQSEEDLSKILEESLAVY